MISPREEAQASQLAASDPAVSAFVAASAGSGKTRLLTDRLLRLMVGGAKPERILCLTFTKAAAAEMSLRLQKRLGQWVTLDDAALANELRGLAIERTETTLRRARSLFAVVLDLPGGMRISTIHAFCQSLLRRFPLEANLSPHFQLAEDRDAAEALTAAREDLLASVRPRGVSNALSDLESSLRVLAGLAKLDRFSELVTALKQGAGAFDAGVVTARRRVLGVAMPDRASVIAASVHWNAEAAVREAAREVAECGSDKVKRNASEMLDWLGLPSSSRAADWARWRGLFLKASGEPYAATSLVNATLARAAPHLTPVLLTEAERVVAVEDAARAADVAQVSEALCTLAEPLLKHYEDRKASAGLLEYDDLINRGTALLVDPGAAWVLYKLDGGLDHLLLDEVQDTAPAQWDIAHGLTQEFFAGAGASEVERTVFAVGDRKQSIFSFQGADVAGFDLAHHRLRDRVAGAERGWRAPGLNVSFRSTTPVLSLVDAVFADPLARPGVVGEEETLLHRADRADHAGCVEIWPLTEAPPPEPPGAWTAPDRNLATTSAVQLLARDIAAWIQQQTSGAELLESQNRALRPGDVMILVRRRDALPAALVRSLKALGVPVSGLDRMALTDQPAVRDLMALADALLLPQDDLTFACLLTSPLGGLNDDDLMELAIGRTRPLWQTLRDRHAEQRRWYRAWTFFNTLLARVDYVTPHALFAEALGALGGRAALLARLGAEAAEPIDELLNAALSYTKVHPPSLQGFLQWLRRSGAEVKREPEAAGNQVRILTVHGAKGLQAPVVILPDTTGMPKNQDSLLWATDRISGKTAPIWVPRAEFQCAATRRLRDEASRKQLEEYNRLLYVAMTRAEDRLVICGAKPKQGEPRETCWYNLVARGFSRLTGETVGGFARHASPQIAIVTPPDLAAGIPLEPAPSFLGRPPPPEPARPQPLAPSRPEGVELGPGPSSASPLARIEDGTDRFKRGSLIHALLQHMPALPETDWADAARRFLSGPGSDLPPDTVAAIAEEVMAILRHGALAPLFGPGSRAEVPLTGVVGDVVVGGLVDRIMVLPDRVLLADYKTNRRPPISAEATPVAYLRQMASYRAVLRTIFPDRPVSCALVWTREARVMELPPALLDPHEPGRASTTAGPEA